MEYVFLLVTRLSAQNLDWMEAAFFLSTKKNGLGMGFDFSNVLSMECSSREFFKGL